MTQDDVEYWPRQLQEIFAAVGEAMGEKRLTPETLAAVRMPDAQFHISHIAGKEIGQRKGFYLIKMKDGQWKFFSGRLERLARAAFQNQLLQKSN